METAKIRLSIPDDVDASLVVGDSDSVLRTLDRLSSAQVVLRGNAISVKGEASEVEVVARFFNHAFAEARGGRTFSDSDVSRVLSVLREGSHEVTSLRDDVLLSHHGRVVRPKTLGQKRYVDAIRKHTVTFCLGPAGTGKTYLAMSMAVAALKRHEVGRIVLTRPVVEAGENLGFLPGTLEEKIDPYMRPLYDAMFDMEDAERVSSLIERGVIEIAPLAYMRGRTLNDAFVVLDEAQNTTPEQMKMFLTRLGFNSKFIVTGDISQRDLPGRGGLTDIEEILDGVEDVSFIHLDRTDVVRHALVGRIVEAYDKYEEAREEARVRRERGRDGRSHQ